MKLSWWKGLAAPVEALLPTLPLGPASSPVGQPEPEAPAAKDVVALLAIAAARRRMLDEAGAFDPDVEALYVEAWHQEHRVLGDALAGR